ncbi:MAG: glycosyltransferase family A protein [Pseudomonadota bacterium]
MFANDFETGLVSVLVTTYNRSIMLRDAIGSVIAQTYPKWEVVIVDDGSTDNTSEVVEEFRKIHGSERIRYFYQKNKGPQDARNRGMAESKGELIQFLDSDDMLHPKKLAIQASFLNRNPSLEFVVGAILDFDDPNNILLDIPLMPWPPMSLEMFTGGTFFLIHAPLFRRESLRRVGPWDEGLVFAHETNYFGRVLACGLRGQYTPTAVGYRRTHKGRYSSTLERRAKAEGMERAYAGICEAAEKNGVPVPSVLRRALVWCQLEVLSHSGEKQAVLKSLDEAGRLLKPNQHLAKMKLRYSRIVVKTFGTKVLLELLGLVKRPWRTG